MWIFGYGSLMWYQDFPHVEVVQGVVKNFSRRFWQKSPDHRGTPEKPGRTVTIIYEDGASVWGMAFKVPEEHEKATKEYLDHREKAGYECVTVKFHPDSGAEPFDVEVYMNIDGEGEHHAGPEDIEEISDIIINSHGPSGPNIEYALRVAKILHDKAPHFDDEHVFALEKRLLQLSKESGKGADIVKKIGYN